MMHPELPLKAWIGAPRESVDGEFSVNGHLEGSYRQSVSVV